MALISKWFCFVYVCSGVSFVSAFNFSTIDRDVQSDNDPIAGWTDPLYGSGSNASSSTLSTINSFQYSKRREFSASSVEDVLQNDIDKKKNTLSKEIDILDVVESNDDETIETSFVVGERMSVIEETDDASDDKPIVTLEIITNKPLRIKNQILSIKTVQDNSSHQPLLFKFKEHGHESVVTNNTELEKLKQTNIKNDSAARQLRKALQITVQRKNLSSNQKQFLMKSVNQTIHYEEKMESPTENKNNRIIHVSKDHQSQLNNNISSNYQNHLDLLRKLLTVWRRRLNVWERHIREKKKKLHRLSPALYNSSEQTVMQNRSISHSRYIYYSNETETLKTVNMTKNRNSEYNGHSDGRKIGQDIKQIGQHLARFYKKKHTKYLPTGKIPQKVIDFFITEQTKANNVRASNKNNQSFITREVQAKNNGAKAKNKIITNILSENNTNRINQKYNASQFHEFSSKLFSHRKNLKPPHFKKISESRQEHDNKISESETPPVAGNFSSSSYIKYLNQEPNKTEHQQNLQYKTLTTKNKRLRYRASSDDAGFTKWSKWSPCSHTCGQAKKVRVRFCAGSLSRTRRKKRKGPHLEIKSCNLKPCTDETYSADNRTSWGHWSACSKTCGKGIQTRKFCVLTMPGKHCTLETRICRLSPCTEMFSMWTHWSRCSRTCGVGLHSRSRKCSSPAVGESRKICKEVRLCNSHCPVHRGLSKWSHWSQCTGYHHNSTRTRRRFCANQPPALIGKKCTGKKVEIQKCHSIKQQQKYKPSIIHLRPNDYCGFNPCKEIGCFASPQITCITDFDCVPLFFDKHGNALKNCTEKEGQNLYATRPTALCGYNVCDFTKCKEDKNLRCVVDLKCNPRFLSTDGKEIKCKDGVEPDYTK